MRVVSGSIFECNDVGATSNNVLLDRTNAKNVRHILVFKKSKMVVINRKSTLNNEYLILHSIEIPTHYTRHVKYFIYLLTYLRLMSVSTTEDHLHHSWCD
jgi:hypothetical protein